MAGYRWAQRLSTVAGAVAVVIWLIRWWRMQSPMTAPVEHRRPAERLLAVAAWTAIGLATAVGAALAVTEDVAPQRMVFLAVTRAGGAALMTATVLAACYAALARQDRLAPR
jgi:hypothetical protein